MANTNSLYSVKFFLAQAMLSLALSWTAQGTAHAKYTPAFSNVKTKVSIYVAKDGASRQIVEECDRLDSAVGIKYLGLRKVPFKKALEDVHILEAYTHQPDGRRIFVPAERIRTQDGTNDQGIIDIRKQVHIIRYPELAIGSQVCVRYATTQRTPDFKGHYFWSQHFSPHSRYENVVIEFAHDPTIDIGVDAQGMQGGAVANLPDDPPGTVRYRFTFSQSTANPPEPGRVDLADFAPHFSASSFKTYADIGGAYHESALPKATITPNIAQQANEVIASAKNDANKVKLLYYWVSQQIRYLNLQTDSGGYVPHEAQQVLENRWGDCKDHVVLFEAMLKAVGIDSTAVLINAAETYTLPKLPTPRIFNHIITYIPSLDLYLDTTTHFVPVGRLPDNDIGKPVVHSASGVVSATPGNSMEDNYTDTTVVMELMAGGRIIGETTAKMSGIFEVESRAAHFSYLNYSTDEIVSMLLRRFKESGNGTITSNDPMTFNAPWTIAATFELDPIVKLPGAVAMMIPTGLATGRLRNFTSDVPPKNRRYSTSCSAARHTESINLTLLPGMQITRLPKNEYFERGAMRYESSYQKSGNRIQIQRAFYGDLRSRICDGKNAADFAALTTVLRRDLRQKIFFK